MELQLKKEVVNKIKSDHDLFAAIGKALKVVPSSLTRKLIANDSDLTEKSIAIILSKHLNVSEDDLFEPKPVKATA